MKKRALIGFLLIFVGNIFSMHPLHQNFFAEKHFGLHKKMATSAFIVSGVVGSCIGVYKKIPTPFGRSCMIAGVFGVAGAALMWVWAHEGRIQKKVIGLLKLFREAEDEKEHCARKKIITKITEKCDALRKKPEFFALLQFNGQMLRTNTQNMISEVSKKNCIEYDESLDLFRKEDKIGKKIKDIVEDWYKMHEKDAIINQMKYEIDSVCSSWCPWLWRAYLIADIKKFFKNEPSRFASRLDEKDHENIRKEIRKRDNWFQVQDKEIKEIITKSV